jgi:hypothetical protein
MLEVMGFAKRVAERHENSCSSALQKSNPIINNFADHLKYKSDDQGRNLDPVLAIFVRVGSKMEGP